MKQSRKYQNLTHLSGIVGSIALFFSGYFLGANSYTLAALVLVINIIFTRLNSELFYRTQNCLIYERLRK